MRNIHIVIFVLLLVGCATTQDLHPSDQPNEVMGEEDCSRFEAATRTFGKAFNPITMQKKVIEDRSRHVVRCDRRT